MTEEAPNPYSTGVEHREQPDQQLSSDSYQTEAVIITTYR